MVGIEPTLPAWEAGVLPLYDTRETLVDRGNIQRPELSKFSITLCAPCSMNFLTKFFCAYCIALFV